MAGDLGDRLDELSLEVDTSALEPTTVDADPVLLELAVRNLVDNAVTHNVRAGRITLQTASDGGSATLTVTNSTTTGATARVSPALPASASGWPSSTPSRAPTKHGSTCRVRPRRPSVRASAWPTTRASID